MAPSLFRPGPARPGRRGFLALAAFLPALTPAAAPAQADPREPVTVLYAGLKQIMRMGKATPFQQRFNQLAPTIDRTFDLDTILRTAAGSRWASFTDAERQSLLSIFRTFTITSYVSNFDTDDGETFDVLPGTRPSNLDQIVLSKFVPKRGDPVEVDYLMRFAASMWRIIDVLLTGSISQTAVQRSDFRSLIAAGGAQGLADSLRRKVVDLSGGAMRP